MIVALRFRLRHKKLTIYSQLFLDRAVSTTRRVAAEN
jgi:hypothetical protein